MKHLFSLTIVLFLLQTGIFAQCEKKFHTNVNQKSVQKLGTYPTFINPDCKIAFESSDKGIFAYIKITNSPPSKIGDQLMFLFDDGTKYFYEYNKDSKELSYNNHTTALELDVRALEWLANNTVTKIGVVNRIQNKIYEYPLDATRQFEFKNVAVCLVTALDRSKASKKTINPSSKARLIPNPIAKKNPPRNSGSNPLSSLNGLASLNSLSNPDSLLKQLEKMLTGQLGGQLSNLDPQLEAVFNQLMAQNGGSGFNLGSFLNTGSGSSPNGGSGFNLNSFLNSGSGSSPSGGRFNLQSMLGSNNFPNLNSSNPITKSLPNLPPNANPDKFDTKEDLETQIERCEGSIQKIQKEIAVNNSSNNSSANPKLVHQVNMYEEEIQNYLNQIKDLGQ